ncbi:hypothetical protein FH966_10345 [Lentibacillus cibarius]|uniref:DUF997 family protein n=1 Tax=Lentibacillus cibarius TaxID=2583219 RepID=A0A549YJK0_9BACI|nr:hypothetical protein [Lentibacillus cibarius]TRM12049.1 hypothetical protein FH966_10345 [Lentibacillus cibarius]
MKATFKHPNTKKGWFSVCLIAFVIALGSWSIINLFNKEIIVLGMPLLMVWSIVLILLTTFAMIIIDKIGGSD